MGDLLKDKVAMVVGAGAVPGPSGAELTGNGQAAAIVYAREGASVQLVDIDRQSAEKTAQIIREEGGSCSVFQADATRAADCQAMAEECVRIHGRIDILHNNIGVGTRKPGGFLGADAEDFDRVLSLNLKSMFNTAQAVLPRMLAQACGAIVNISSIASLIANYPDLLYNVSKAAVNTFTRSLAAEFAARGIRVNCLMPGMINTPAVYPESLLQMYGGSLDKVRQELVRFVPMGRIGEPWDIANAALFLVSDRATYITGQVIAVDGGVSMNWAVPSPPYAGRKSG